MAFELPHKMAFAFPHRIAFALPQRIASALPHKIAPALPHKIASALPQRIASALPHKIALASALPHRIASAEVRSLPVSRFDLVAKASCDGRCVSPAMDGALAGSGMDSAARTLRFPVPLARIPAPENSAEYWSTMRTGSGVKLL